MRTVHVFVRYILNHSKIPFVVHGFRRGHVRMQAHLPVVGQVGVEGDEFPQAVFRNGDVRSIIVVLSVLVNGDHRVEAIVPPVHFDEHQYPVVEAVFGNFMEQARLIESVQRHTVEFQQHPGAQERRQLHEITSFHSALLK